MYNARCFICRTLFNSCLLTDPGRLTPANCISKAPLPKGKVQPIGGNGGRLDGGGKREVRAFLTSVLHFGQSPAIAAFLPGSSSQQSALQTRTGIPTRQLPQALQVLTDHPQEWTACKVPVPSGLHLLGSGYTASSLVVSYPFESWDCLTFSRLLCWSFQPFVTSSYYIPFTKPPNMSSVA